MALTCAKLLLLSISREASKSRLVRLITTPNRYSVKAEWEPWKGFNVARFTNLGSKPPLLNPFIRSLFILFAVCFGLLGPFLLTWTKAPLRRITERNLTSEIARGMSTVGITDTLECGHTSWAVVDARDLLNAYTEDSTMRARRHRCRECQAIAVAKKPPASVRIPSAAVSA